MIFPRLYYCGKMPVEVVGMADNETLSVAEAAEYLGVHVKTVRSWADKGLIPSVRWPNGWRRFRPADLDAVRAKMGTAPAST